MVNNRDFDSDEYKEFRREVRARDGGCCQWPNCKERRHQKTVVHHIRSWAHFPSLRFDPKNGIVLCKKHHKIVTGSEPQFLSLFMQIVHRNSNG